MEKGSSSSSSSAAGGGADSLNGLKFGKKIYFEGVGSGTPQPPSPAKKGRTGGVTQGGQPPRCQVEGCKVDLSDAKPYYSRHKVCGMHSKFPKVIVAGLEQRFCQQCSRFHQLPEFDQGKRSCRRRLAGHNERRRKPPPGSLLSPYYGSVCPPPLFDNRGKTRGAFMMDFSSYTTVTGNSVSGGGGGGGGGGLEAVSGKPQLTTWQSSSQNHHPIPIFDIHQGTTDSVPSECFSGVSDSGSALSLLSNQPWLARTPRGIGVNNFLSTSTGGMTLAQPQPSINPNPGAEATTQFAIPWWGGSKAGGTQATNTLHEMPPDMGLAQFSHPPNTHYAGELGLAQPSDDPQFHELDHSRGYDSSTHHMHWSL